MQFNNFSRVGKSPLNWIKSIKFKGIKSSYQNNHKLFFLFNKLNNLISSLILVALMLNMFVSSSHYSTKSTDTPINKGTVQ